MQNKEFPDNYHDLVRLSVNQFFNNNRVAIINHGQLTAEEIESVNDMVQKIIKHRDDYIYGGGFVEGLVNNDLLKTIEHADPLTLRALKFYLLVKLWVHPLFN